MDKSNWSRILAYGLMAAGVVTRLAMNAFGVFNFNPTGAVGLFGGARLPAWQAYVLPLALMIPTDLILTGAFNNPEYSLTHPSRLWVYGCYLLYVLIGRFVIGASKSPVRIATATLLGAAQFYLITNFCEWLAQPDRYNRDLSGLLASYVAAIPFSLNTLAGDVIFTPLVFGLHAYLTRETVDEKTTELASEKV